MSSAAIAVGMMPTAIAVPLSRLPARTVPWRDENPRENEVLGDGPVRSG